MTQQDHPPQQPLDELQALCARLRLKGEQVSEIGRMLAQSKSLRQDGHNPPRDDLYMWPTPEQTTEWKAADTLERQAQEIQRLRPEALIAAISHGDDEHRAWLSEAIHAFWKSEPVPPPRGSGRKDAEIQRLREALTVARQYVLVHADDDGELEQIDAALSSENSDDR